MMRKSVILLRKLKWSVEDAIAVSEADEPYAFDTGTDKVLQLLKTVMPALMEEKEVPESIRELINNCVRMLIDASKLLIGAKERKDTDQQVICLREIILPIVGNLRTGLSDTQAVEKRISIVIPCYNAENDIDNMLECIESQTIGFEYLEVICVNDASPDHTLDHLLRWEKEYPDEFIIVDLAENGRQGRARNIGVQNAHSPYVLFLDADDEIYPYTCLKMWDIAEKTGVEVVAADFVLRRGDELVASQSYDGEINTAIYITGREDRRKLLRVGLRMNTVNKLYKRDIFEKYDLKYPEGITYEDNYFGTLLQCCIDSYCVIDDVCYIWDLHVDSTSHKRNDLRHFDRLVVSDMLMDELDRRGIYKDYADELDRIYLDLYFLNTIHVIFTRFDKVPYEQMDQMIRGFCTRYPNFRDSSIYSNLKFEYQRELIDLAFAGLTHHEWDDLRIRYLQMIGMG